MPFNNIARERSLYTSTADTNLPVQQRELARLREQVSTGKKINRPSDDAAGFARARRMEALTNQYAQYERNIDAARGWTTATQQHLNELSDLYMTAREEGVRAANAARLNSQEERDVMAGRLESLREEAITHFNARYGDEYLFAGNRTNEKPFDTDGQPSTAYADISGDRTREIHRDQRLKINTDGAELHDTGEGYTVISAFDNLIDAVRNGDENDLQAALGEMKTSQHHLVDLGAEAGTRAERLTMAREQLQGATLQAQTRQSELEDADLMETITRLQKTQGALEAALKVTASVRQTSLLDYLR